MSFGILIFGIIISVIAMLGTLIMAIISLATGKQRNGIIYGVAFIMSLVLAVLSISETAKRGADKVGDGIAWLKDLDEKNKSYSNTHEEESYYAYIPEWNKDTVQAEFYYSQSEDGKQYYIPLVYPYRFVAADSTLEEGYLENFTTGKEHGAVRQITSFCFNGKHLLAKVKNVYLFFDFETGESSAFDSEQKMEEEASRQGFYNTKSLESISDHYWKYAESGGC